MLPEVAVRETTNLCKLEVIASMRACVVVKRVTKTLCENCQSIQLLLGLVSRPWTGV